MNYDRIILELIDRVSKLEDEIKVLKSQQQTIVADNVALTSDGTTRDKTKYILNGVRFGKNRLVLAIVNEYVKRNPKISAEELLNTFDKSLQGSLGVIRTIDDAQANYSDHEKRFFCKENEIIRTTTRDCVVCSQWDVKNIGNIIARADELGINVTAIKV